MRSDERGSGRRLAFLRRIRLLQSSCNFLSLTATWRCARLTTANGSWRRPGLSFPPHYCDKLRHTRLIWGSWGSQPAVMGNRALWQLWYLRVTCFPVRSHQFGLVAQTRSVIQFKGNMTLKMTTTKQTNRNKIIILDFQKCTARCNVDADTTTAWKYVWKFLAILSICLLQTIVQSNVTNFFSVTPVMRYRKCNQS